MFVEGDVDLLEAGFPGVVHIEHGDKPEKSEEQELNFMKKSDKLILFQGTLSNLLGVGGFLMY